VLDSRGEATVVLKGNTKLKLDDSADNNIWTIDNILSEDVNLLDASKITDEDGNEQIVFQTTTSAVNYLEVTNAATSSGPILAVNGSDSNVSFNIDAKGTGTIDISAAALQIDYGATGPGEVRLLEDSDNGTNYMGFKSPAAVTSSLSLELPDGDGTSGDTLTTNASGVLAWTAVVANTVTAGITASTTQTQGQQPLTSRINEVSTVATTNDTVTLPSAVAGLFAIVINNGANTMKIFPASGDNLGAGVDTATTLAAGSNVHYVAYDATNWESI